MSWDWRQGIMKSEDIGLLLKFISLQNSEEESASEDATLQYTTRALEQSTGISRSQISRAIKRCYDVRLAKPDRNLGIPRTNRRAIYGFVISGIKYVFPAKANEITRGTATAFAAPVLKGRIMSAGDFFPVWPDAMGEEKGQAVEPLFKTASYAAKQDLEFYDLLALVDAIRLGLPRETQLASELLAQKMGI